MKRLLVFIILTMILFLPKSYGYIVGELRVFVWEDGNVTIDEVIYPEDYEILIQVPLMGDNVRDILVMCEGNYRLPYTFQNNSLLIETRNSTRIRIIYTVNGLVFNEGSLWTITLNLPRSPAEVVLPQGAEIVGLSDIPIKVVGNNTILIGPGNVTIYYTFPGLFEGEKSPLRKVVMVLMTITLVLIATTVFLRKRKSKRNTSYFEDKVRKIAKQYNLNDDEIRAIKYLLEVGGKSSQADLRKALDLPKTTAWRMVRRLEQMGLIKVYKVGRENWVELNIDMHKLT
ncbi:helix-turn-helix transcriptional regulator [Pyrococcus kukulkanii]|uniref:helix-turn-helix transcriptional regulator n=1 Tax=Pyrococcus kukulkanii TaxID=1609559 RepID=UPI00356544F7